MVYLWFLLSLSINERFLCAVLAFFKCSVLHFNPFCSKSTRTNMLLLGATVFGIAAVILIIIVLLQCGDKDKDTSSV